MDEVLDVLRSIDATLKAMLALAQQRTAQARAAAPKPVASDRDLDGKYGDPVLKFMPRDWTGPVFTNRKFSECPPALLEMVAETFDYFATQADAKNERANNGKPVGDYKRQDAARARGWAKRMRSGIHPTPQIDQPVVAAAGSDGWPAGDAWS